MIEFVNEDDGFIYVVNIDPDTKQRIGTPVKIPDDLVKRSKDLDIQMSQLQYEIRNFCGKHNLDTSTKDKWFHLKLVVEPHDMPNVKIVPPQKRRK